MYFTSYAPSAGSCDFPDTKPIRSPCAAIFYSFMKLRTHLGVVPSECPDSFVIYARRPISERTAMYVSYPLLTFHIEYDFTVVACYRRHPPSVPFPGHRIFRRLSVLHIATHLGYG
jgi:hypothetical protein